ncbi:hypothetical protein IPH25_02205 [bacterium]|nr:MAG: hypothetical protein IPH25_02205 [bacterium]
MLLFKESRPTYNRSNNRAVGIVNLNFLNQTQRLHFPTGKNGSYLTNFAQQTTLNENNESKEAHSEIVLFKTESKINLTQENQLSVKSNAISLQSFVFTLADQNKHMLLQGGINLAARFLPYGHIVSNWAPALIQTCSQVCLISGYKKEIETLMKTITELQQKKTIGKEAQKEVKKLTRENGRLLIKNASTETINTTLQNTVEQKNQEIKALKTKEQTIKQELARANILLQENETQLQAAEKKLHDLKSQLKNLEEKQKTELLKKHQKFEMTNAQLQNETTQKNEALMKFTKTFEELTKANEKVQRLQKEKQDLEQKLKLEAEKAVSISQLILDKKKLKKDLKTMEREKNVTANEAAARKIAEAQKDAKLAMYETFSAGAKFLLLLQIVRWSYDYNPPFAATASFFILKLYVTKATEKYHSITETYKKHETKINFAMYTTKLLLNPILINFFNDYVDA